MPDPQLEQLKQHVESAEQDLGAGLDVRLNELGVRLRLYLASAWHRDVDADEAKSAAVRLLAAANLVADRLSPSLVRWLANGIHSPARDFLQYVRRRRREQPVRNTVCFAGEVPTIHLFERLLSEIDPGQRRRAGVFYTPRPIVQYIVKQTHRLLQEEFHLPDGLADISAQDWFGGEEAGKSQDTARIGSGPRVQILDPAVGTGVFLVESIEVIHQTLAGAWRSSGAAEGEIRRRWNRYVTAHLLPRLTGVDLMPAPCLLAACHIVLKLLDTGYDFPEPGRINVHVADSLGGPLSDVSSCPLPARWKNGLARAVGACQEGNPTVVLGNPPYAALCNSTRPWIEQLIRGRLPGNAVTGSYYELDGQSLNERKLWLHDDYVKFMRFGQWKIEQARCGILAFVTNHGYLDNPTFRGMRRQLELTFPYISLVDLHGNAKKKETSIDGRPDQNVFDVEQGIVIGLFRKTPRPPARRKLEYRDVWGTRERKYAWLQSQAEFSGNEKDRNVEDLSPVAPFHFFVPRDNSLDDEYRRGVPLTEVFPLHGSAVVTARDSFVIAFERDELVRRIEAFRDLAMPDDELRSRYFGNTRSRKYAAGDTRGWKLSEARRRLADDHHWQQRIRHCLYRPCDKRYVYWSREMIDWPRTNVTRHFVDGENLALIARRQMLPTQPCRYFWVADEIPIDGVIRSDNRGNETVFPLYLYGGQSRVNLDPDFVQRLAGRFNLTWIESGCGDLHSTIGPEAIAQYIYAMFHASEYRQRYAAQLRVEFPRVFFPVQLELLRCFAERGCGLIASHRTSQFSGAAHAKQTSRCAHSDRHKTLLDGGYPKWKAGRVYINASTWFDGIAAEAWGFHAGGHQVLRKWLKDRRGRHLSEMEMHSFPRIVQAVQDTLRIVARIDHHVASAGGWQHAFDVGT